MAKKGTTTRVFQLAKQLGVSSKDVVEKCKSEDVPGITNHMSAVSLGLAETIREWFSNESAGNVTIAVQAAPPVDVVIARAKAKKKAAKKTVTKAKTGGKDAEPIEEAPAEPMAPAEVEAAPAEE